MASPFVSNVSMTAPTDYAMESRNIERQRRMAEMLQQQAMAPEQQQMAGGYVIPTGWGSALAKALQGYAGFQGQRKADEREKDLIARQTAARTADSSALAKYLRGSPGIPEQPPMTPNDDDGNPNPPVAGTPAVAPMSGDAPSFQTPEYQQLLAQMLVKQAEKGMEAPTKVDLGDRWGLMNNQGQVVGYLPKSASPDAVLRSNTTVQTHQTPSGSAILQADAANQRHATPSGSAVLGSQTTLQTHATPSGSALVGADTARRGQDIGAATARRGQDMSADPALQGRIAEARGAGAATGTATAQAAMDLPNATAKAEQAMQLIDQMVGSTDGKVKRHPGFSGVVGATLTPGMRFVEGTDAAGFSKLLDQVKGGAFMQAYETLKGGGQITEVEGAKATAAITRMDKAQSEKEFTAAAREFQGVIRAGVQRARQKAGRRASDAPGAVIDFNSLP